MKNLFKSKGCEYFSAPGQKIFTNFSKFFSWHILGGAFTSQIDTEEVFSTLIPRLDIVEVLCAALEIGLETR